MGRVLVLDDDVDLVDSLVDLLRFFKRPCLTAHSVAELHAQADDALDCDLALLDLNLGEGEPSGIDAYRWLRERRFPGRVTFLTGHGQSHPLIAQARRLDNVDVLSKPLTNEQLRTLFRP